MKRLNKKWITLMLAGVCAASLGIATVGITNADDEPKAATYEIKNVFSVGTGNEDALVPETEGEKKTVAFTLGNDKYARFTRKLAYKWYEDDGNGNGVVKYFNTKFAFKNFKFDSVTLQMESDSSVANEEEKSVNSVKFTVKEGKLYATVLNGDEEGEEKLLDGVTEGSDILLAFTAGSAFDSFGVTINGVSVGEFTHIAGNYATYDYGEKSPLEFKAKTTGEDKAVIIFKELNGQSFENLEKEKIVDNAAPVLVVNDTISGFQYGTQFNNLTFEKIDVLKSSLATSDVKMTYYQYNPAETELDMDVNSKTTSYKTLTTSTKFRNTVYYTDGTNLALKATDGYEATSVFVETAKADPDGIGKEYISVKFSLGDGYKSQVIDLAWYAETSAIEVPTLGGAAATAAKYIVVDSNETAPVYAYITANDTTFTNDVNETDLNVAMQKYQERLDKAVEDTLAGSNSTVTIPDVEWLIKDNGGYQAMNFTISYYAPNATSPTNRTAKKYTDLTIPTSAKGYYQFRIFAADAAGNTMKYYNEDKEFVEVTTSNVWDIEGIPDFTFYVGNDQGIKIKTDTTSARKEVSKKKDQTYTFSGVTVVGAEDLVSEFALYRLDFSNYSGKVDSSAFTEIKYGDIQTAALQRLGDVGTVAGIDTYFDLYLDIYAEKLVAKMGGNKDELVKCFLPIQEYDADITKDDKAEWEAYNQYNWNPSSKSFKTAKEGRYLLLADYYEDELANKYRATAYKVVVVGGEKEVVQGDSQFGTWVRNNVVSVVLFGVAGVMLIAIIILLFVKPSDETLEDVEAKAKAKTKKKDE